MKKILMVCFVFPPRFSGAAFQAISLARVLSERGKKCDFFVANYLDNSFWHQRQEYGCNIYRVKKGVFFPLALFFFLILKRKDYSVVHFHGISNIHFLCVYMAKLFKLKVVQKLTKGNAEMNELTRKGRLKFFRKFAYKITDKFIAISTALEDGLKEQGIPERKICMIPNGVDIDVYRPMPSMKNKLRKQFGYKPQDYILIFVGIIHPFKNLMPLLQAFEIALRKMKHLPVKLILAGPLLDVDYFNELNNFIEQKKIADHVSFLGRVDSQTIVKLNVLSDVMVFAGMSEGGPSVLVEGKCCGLPLIAFKSGGVEDRLSHGIDGYLIKPGDLTGFADSIVKLHDDKMRRQFSLAGIKDCMETYPFDEIVSQYIETIYNFS